MAVSTLPPAPRDHALRVFIEQIADDMTDKNLEDIVFYMRAKDCRYVTFHVKGKVNRKTVEELQSNVARWLKVPLEFVSLAGVEVTDSFNIILMIPELSTEMLRKHVPLNSEWLMSQGMDTCKIDGEDIDLTDLPGKGVSSPLPKESEDLSLQELKRLMDENKFLQSRVETLQYERLARYESGDHQPTNDSVHSSLAPV
ncbi:uncharacterized protein LOC135479653 isoform X2 [Liolophura sinensis]|uniref:uncharacterized protein LOC135479653 isoform X2 n=1 Tax=Liolophura sinensis TaxID=3198878 RepID=UPI0031589180